METTREESQPILFDDVLEHNIFRNSSINNYPLAGLNKFKIQYIDSQDEVREGRAYDYDSQREYRYDGDTEVLNLSLMREEDAALAEYVVDALKLNGKWIRKTPHPGYKYVYQISYPWEITSWPIGKYLAVKDIDPSVFAKPNRAEAAKKKGQKLADKEAELAAQESEETDVQLLGKFANMISDPMDQQWIGNGVRLTAEGKDVLMSFQPKGFVVKEFGSKTGGDTVAVYDDFNDFLDDVDYWFNVDPDQYQKLYR